MTEAVDFVICWVDDQDESWIAEKSKYTGASDDKHHFIRYRNWDNLHFWFRGVESFAPWVRKIHFVTWGHLPAWLNTEHPKLNIVKHSDYIAKEFLPTFSCRPLEINLHRIRDLAEQFVYFNDDMFIVRHVRKDEFFLYGKPRDIAVMDIGIKGDEIHGSAILNAIMVINRHFKKRNVVKNHFFKWYSPVYGRYLIKTIMLIPWKIITGFYTPHMPNAFLKSTFTEVWDKEPELLKQTTASKFRTTSDLNQYLFRFWQLASGNFIPRSNIGRQFNLGREKEDALLALEKQKYKIICLNDSELISDFECLKAVILSQFDKIFPHKSEYEI